MLQVIELTGGSQLLLPKKLSFTDNVFKNPSSTESLTLNVGREADDRLVVMAIVSSNDNSQPTWDSVLLNGTDALLAVKAPHGGNSNNPGAGIWYAHIPEGETVDLDIAFGQDPESLMIGVYTITGLESYTPTDTDLDTNGSVLTVDVPTRGAFILGCAGGAITLPVLTTDQLNSANGLAHRTSHSNLLDAATGYSVGSGGSGINAASVVAVWR